MVVNVLKKESVMGNVDNSILEDWFLGISLFKNIYEMFVFLF